MMFFFFFIKNAEPALNFADKLAGERLDAIEKVMQYVQTYRENGILPWLTDRVLEKKLEWIKAAQTKAELAEIAKPSVPHYTGGGFFEGKYHVKEEEMILWSQASLMAPLNQTGYNRYMELFREFFPKEAGEICNSSYRSAH